RASPSATRRRAAAGRCRPRRGHRAATRAPSGRSLQPFAGEGDEILSGARPRAPGCARDVDVAREIEVLDACLGERAGGELGLDGAPRDEGDAEAALDGAPHRFLEPELEGDTEVAKLRAALAQLVLDHLPDARALLHQDQRPLGKLLERYGSAGERVARR